MKNVYYYNFDKWFNENYYELNNEIRYKDIIQGNKIYSHNCIFVPDSINCLFIIRKARGDCLLV